MVPVAVTEPIAPCSWRIVTASCALVPSATLVIWRSVLVAALPTDTAPARFTSVVLYGTIAVPAVMVPLTGASARSDTDPEPSATPPSTLETAPLPIAMLFVLLATACGPTAMLSVPSAWLSASVELAWKYLMPAPLLISPMMLFRLAILVVLVAMLLVFRSTCWLVAYSCEPFTASVDVLLRRPAATLVMVRSAPTAPTLTVEVGVAPAKV